MRGLRCLTSWPTPPQPHPACRAASQGQRPSISTSMLRLSTVRTRTMIGQDDHAVERRLDRHRLDDVPRHQKLETEQQRSAEEGTQATVGIDRPLLRAADPERRG